MTDERACIDCGKWLNPDPTPTELVDSACSDEVFRCVECCATSEVFVPCDECLFMFDSTERVGR